MNNPKIILAFDKFKGSMTASEANEAAKRGILRSFPNAEFRVFPAADGGEGTVDAVCAALHGHKETCIVTPPHETFNDTHKVKATYAVVPAADGETCVMEMAQASGLLLVPPDKRNPMDTSTCGTGEMLLAALDRGCRRFLIGIGGSATNDGGAGMAAALGAKFYDADGERIPHPVGASLSGIASCDLSGMDNRLRDCVFTVCCDVDNPMTGENGAAYVFAPQKGASAEDIKRLDSGLFRFGQLLEAETGVPVLRMAGAGAAGGLGGGMAALLGARLVSGIEAVMALAGFDAMLDGADLVLTGEGKLDAQTLGGKTVCGILSHARKKHVPVIALCGAADAAAYALLDRGLSGIFPIPDRPMTLSESMENGIRLTEQTARNAVSALFAREKE